MSREARVWLKIVCACLLPGKHVTYVTRERVCLFYALMTRMPINVTKEHEGVNGPVLSVNEHNTRIDKMLSHLYSMQILQLRMNGVTEKQLQQLNMNYPLSENSRALCRLDPGFEDPIDDDVITEDEMARVHSDIESSDAEEKDSKMGEAALAPTNDEE
ncbi:hypothetical protein HAX54_005587 [Datura stramonium]|uniref:Uncharacterized protein n=1 Tax=Datura stramonium TaxID=4076 RepID=A0ABS8T908_DATST|nr:hypothetical protein [Datura stramonium]